MKMIYAIIQDDDEKGITKALLDHEFYVTRVASSGGFLKKGSTTLMMGVEDDRVEKVLEIIRSEAHHHTTSIPATKDHEAETINAGGATVFVLESERFEKF